ncbi:hypothetical protein [Streptomyces sp. bgisy060]|uniref:hypothetical protein n=1 Tax=Streptomyces sp. bgisy060 TaxID=3413775 RepID=UPI003EB82AC1
MTDPTTLPHQPLTRQAIALDVAHAQDLATREPTGDVADQVRDRLRTVIRTLAGDAERYARSLDDSRAQDIAINTIRHARSVAEDPVGDPAANLRLLAGSAQSVARYARQAGTAAGEPS